MIVVRFFDVTKPASICDHKKFRNHENDSLQITRPSLIEVLIPLYYSNIRIFFGEFSADKNSAANSTIGGGLGVYHRHHQLLLLL